MIVVEPNPDVIEKPVTPISPPAVIPTPPMAEVAPWLGLCDYTNKVVVPTEAVADCPIKDTFTLPPRPAREAE